jgi:Tfp pilus assembly protein PilF
MVAALGPTHPSVGRVLGNPGALRVNTGRYDEAAELFQRALAITERAGPAGSMQVAGILNNITVCDIERGRFGAGEPYLLRSMRIREAALPSDDPVMISLLETYNADRQRIYANCPADGSACQLAVDCWPGTSPEAMESSGGIFPC